MARIVILGNTAGGKSTLARRLARASGLQHVEIDRLYWQSDWTDSPTEIYLREHERAIAGDAWIIDGGGDLPSVRKRCERATRIILVDLPLWMHFWLAAVRHAAWERGEIEHPPAGIRTAPPLRDLFEIISIVDRDWMPVLRELCDERATLGVEVTRLTSLEAISTLACEGEI